MVGVASAGSCRPLAPLTEAFRFAVWVAGVGHSMNGDDSAPSSLEGLERASSEW